MPRKDTQLANLEPPEDQQLNAAVGRRVLDTLGRPDGLLRVQVRQLWGDYYRVNVFVGLDAARATIAHSFFLVADGAGNIVTSTPEILKRYGVAEG